MATLTDIVHEEVTKYASSGRGAGIRLFPALDDYHQVYTVVAVDYPTKKDLAYVVILARIADDHIIIEEDTTDKPLVNALLQRGVPREKIVLAYQGEPVPDPIEMF
jgi:hypothetical protein